MAPGVKLSADKINEYLEGIFHPGDTKLPILQCPITNHTRYKSLVVPEPWVSGDDHIQYFFALDLRKNLELLPRLIGSIIEVAQFLGPKHCALSIVEGNSDDGTGEVLQALQPSLETIGMAYIYKSSDINPAKGDRIVDLANLRNVALEPLTDSTSPVSLRVNDATSIIFINDVAICPDDILELALQRKDLGAHMTCAMDWNYPGDNALFYDVWIARTITGDLFFEIPPNGSWDKSWNIFWSDEATKARFLAHRPFQVFSCWNGATVFTAKPILEGLRFRGPSKKECMQGEPELLCKDMWMRGYDKIAVVPTVNLEYTIDKGKKVKKDKGFVADLVREQDAAGDKIEWLPVPKKVKCMPEHHRQSWEPWNQGFEGDKVN